MGIPGEEFCIPALKLLTNIKLCNYNIVKCVDVGDEVVVIGAGRTAVDVVDTLLRQGVKIYLVYRRSIVESRAYDLLKKFLNYVSIIEKSTTTQVMRSGNELLVKICKVEKLNDWIDNNEDKTGIYNISGAKDAVGNEMVADTSNQVTVDTLNPTVTLITPNLTQIIFFNQNFFNFAQKLAGRLR